MQLLKNHFKRGYINHVTIFKCYHQFTVHYKVITENKRVAYDQKSNGLMVYAFKMRGSKINWK